MWAASCCPHRFSISAAVRRHHRRRHVITQSPTTSVPDQNLNLVINTHTLRQHMTETVNDLKTLISFDNNNNNLVLSCRRESLVFVGNVTLAVFVVIVVFRVLVRLGFRRVGDNGGGMVYRRDRSLGGRQVLVGRKGDLTHRIGVLGSGARKSGRRKEERPLPRWWPVLMSPTHVAEADKEEYQKMADRLIRAILDQRIIGNDISEHDIVQFRRFCRGSGVRVFIETTNARDSFYRASVDFVLKVCESVDYHSTSVNIDGEDAHQFVAGIAGNIGVEDSHAARIVTASIAARTRSCFLQAWALEMQGKHSEAAAELSKICLLHRIFPPEENSPEMEMVARSLEKNLKLEQRKILMGMLAGICKDGNHRSVAEALGLVSLPEIEISREAS